ncbi:unnamed protein product [Symbiodinium microadriaticum]|nr:unnamed protein product [Symbiodinium sp. KB8]CAE7333598.1 unnamed protein product [Symbiodinium microadriaticum]
MDTPYVSTSCLLVISAAECPANAENFAEAKKLKAKQQDLEAQLKKLENSSLILFVRTWCSFVFGPTPLGLSRLGSSNMPTGNIRDNRRRAFPAAFSILAIANAQAPCTWNATEPCYLQLGSVFEYRDRGTGGSQTDATSRENDCDGRSFQPYIDAINSLNGGKGLMVHSAGLEIAQSRPYPKYYYQLNYTRLTFEDWSHGHALGQQLFPKWSYIAGMGNGCNDALLVEQAKLANATARIWVSPRGPWSQLSRASGGPLPWAFSSHLDSWDYAKLAAQQFALKMSATAKRTAAILYSCCGNKFFEGVRLGARQHLEDNGITISLHEGVRSDSAVSDIENAVERLVAMEVDVVFTSFGGQDFSMFIESLEKHRELHVPSGIFAVNLPWVRNGVECWGLGKNCTHFLTGAQVMAFQRITNSSRDGVIGLNGSEWRAQSAFPSVDYDLETGLSAFLQAVQGVFQFREVRDPLNLLHSAADPDVYTAVRNLMLSGDVFGNTFAGPAAFSPLGQMNGMTPPVATVAATGDLAVLFPPEFAQAAFEYPVPAAQDCEANFYKNFSEVTCPFCAAECTHCPEHSERLDPATTCSCKELYYAGNSSECKLCPEGLICKGGSQLGNLNLSRGFWRAGRFVEEILPCQVDACLGGTAYGDEGCDEGHTGPLCAVCCEAHYYDSYTKRCLPCSSSGAFWGPQQWLIALLVLLLLAWVFLRKKIKGVLTSSTRNEHAKLKEVNTKLKIAVSLLQVMNTIPAVFRFIDWPATLLQFLEALSMFNLSLFQVVPADCIHPNTFYDRLVVTTLLPLSLWVVLAVVCYFRIWSLKAEKRRRDETQSNFIGAALMVAYLVLPSVSSTIFDTFKCQSFSLDDGRVGTFLQADLAIDCNAEVHSSYVIYAGIMTVVYPIGIPIWMAASLWRHRKAIDPDVSMREMSKAQEVLEGRSSAGSLKSKFFQASKLSKLSILSKSGSSLICSSDKLSVSEEEKAGPANVRRQYKAVISKESQELAKAIKREKDPQIKHLLFIFDDYKPSSMYYEVFESVRKVFLSGVLALCAPGSWLQVVIGIFACQLSLRVLQRYAPYANPNAGSAAETAQRLLFVNLLFGLLILSAESEDPEILGWEVRPASLMTSLLSFAVIAGTVSFIVFTLLFSISELESLQAPKDLPEEEPAEEREVDELDPNLEILEAGTEAPCSGEAVPEEHWVLARF